MSQKSSGKQRPGGRAGGSGPYVENDPGLVRQRPASAGSDSLQVVGNADQVDVPAEWGSTEQLAEPILLQAQRLLEAAGSLDRAVAALEKAGAPGDTQGRRT